MAESQIIEADLTWTGDRFERGVQVEVTGEGRIGRVGAIGPTPTKRLSERALLPGMVNAHSHAFQRGLRGRGETFAEGGGSFWSWREAMYDLVEPMTADRIYELSRQAFGEMLGAGITAVGEFHYLHHDATEDGYAFDEIVLRAAADAGIRIVLLNAYYASGGIGQPLAGPQRRFGSTSPARYWSQMDRLGELMTSATQSLGVVAHSIRAVPIDEIVALHEEADRRSLPFHMHVEEQPREIAECVRHYHKPPMALLNDRLQISPRFTAVHCTHTALEDMDDFLQAGGNVCICPLTEANLGDGIANVPHLRRRYGRICLGSDSNARISMLEEMRWLEYVQRLHTQSRGVCVDEAGDVARPLWAAATVNGAHALGLHAGAVRSGSLADLITVDLTARDLTGWTEATLLAGMILGAGDGVIDEVCVGGRWIRG